MFNNIKVDFNMGYIYLRKNLSNGKCYVGQAKDIKVRNGDWKNLNKRYAGKVINNARKKYGADGFSFEILKECEDEELNYWEMYYIKMYNSKKPYGYNATDGGDSVCEMTDETRKKIADTLRGKKLSEETKAKIAVALKGRKHSPEHIAKVVDALKGRKLSEEIKEKISAAQRGKPNTKKSKPIQALDKNGNVIYEFASTMEAQRQGFEHSSISQCCNGKRKTHKGFIWKFKEKK